MFIHRRLSIRFEAWRCRSFLFSFLVLFLASLACSSLEPSAKSRPTEWSGTLRATFIGQDGKDYAGKLCSAGTKPDNVHVHLSGIRSDQEPVAFRVEDPSGGGLWATPCDPVSNWFLYVMPVTEGETDIYFKPFREAPEGTEYTITVSYDDGVTQMAVIEGASVKP
jgi:hypothetical protein